MAWIQTAQLNNFEDFRAALLVVAHPDDEVMFFSPLLECMARFPKRQFHLLCLSTGNFDGLGEMRKEELLKCVQIFNIAQDYVHIVDHPALQDGMDNVWPMDVISSTVIEYISKFRDIDVVSFDSVDRTVEILNVYDFTSSQVFTFDSYGVSGHPNHIATFHGVKHALLSLQNNSSASIKGYCLSSKNLVRKYLGLFDIIFSLCLDENVLVSWALIKTILGMQAHQSQNIWHRKIFILISSYSYINCFVPFH
jgi:N-acetylglucosaminylphosphatidylinositol deacetylase